MEVQLSAPADAGRLKGSLLAGDGTRSSSALGDLSLSLSVGELVLSSSMLQQLGDCDGLDDGRPVSSTD